MSRRRGEFEHRTSIFEGAFRAWSHLGGLEPEALETTPATDLDPLTNPLTDDPRLAAAKKESSAGEGLRIHPYEPLPRSGLAHPYVQAILSPWLGSEADHDAIQLGLTTLRTWWQHRRKGESGTAVAALGTEKMRGVVEGYTRHFFNLAYCLVVNDKEQPPRTLHTKMKNMEKMRNKMKKKRAREDDAGKLAALAYGGPPAYSAEQEANLSPLERLHASQRRQLAESGGITTTSAPISSTTIDMKGKCVPGKLDLPAVVDSVNRQATQLAHRGQTLPNAVTSSSTVAADEYGDPNMTPVVFVSQVGDIQIAMSVDGITCAHCVKIVETVLKGCNGNKSPIDGLLDAAADRALSQVLIKIDKASNAKRIAFESARNLSMVGYTAKVKEMSIVNAGKATMDLGALSTAFEVVANTDPKDVFDWNTPCSCPDNGILRDDCPRHSQMNTRIFEAFETREQQVTEYMAGCGQKYGMPCTCGEDCRCKNCEEHCAPKQQQRVDNSAAAHAMHEPLPITEGHCCPPPVEQNQKLLTPRNSILSFGGVLRRMSLTSENTFGRAMSGLSALSIDWENMEDFDVNVDHSAHINNNYVPPAPKVPEDGIAAGCNMMTGGECNCGPDCLCAGCPIHDTAAAAASPPAQHSKRRSSMRKPVAPGESDNNGGMQVSFKV